MIELQETYGDDIVDSIAWKNFDEAVYLLKK
jgi:hypothetical protein